MAATSGGVRPVLQRARGTLTKQMQCLLYERSVLGHPCWSHSPLLCLCKPVKHPLQAPVASPHRMALLLRGLLGASHRYEGASETGILASHAQNINSIRCEQVVD
eukprot:3232245-Amphidinium_carterae.2